MGQRKNSSQSKAKKHRILLPLAHGAPSEPKAREHNPHLVAPRSVSGFCAGAASSDLRPPPPAAAAAAVPLRNTAPTGASTWPSPSRPVPRLMPPSSVLCQEGGDGGGGGGSGPPLRSSAVVSAAASTASPVKEPAGVAWREAEACSDGRGGCCASPAPPAPGAVPASPSEKRANGEGAGAAAGPPIWEVRLADSLADGPTGMGVGEGEEEGEGEGEGEDSVEEGVVKEPDARPLVQGPPSPAVLPSLPLLLLPLLPLPLPASWLGENACRSGCCRCAAEDGLSASDAKGRGWLEMRRSASGRWLWAPCLPWRPSTQPSLPPASLCCSCPWSRSRSCCCRCCCCCCSISRGCCRGAGGWERRCLCSACSGLCRGCGGKDAALAGCGGPAAAATPLPWLLALLRPMLGEGVMAWGRREGVRGGGAW